MTKSNGHQDFAIRACSLTKRFGRQVAVNQLDLSIRRGTTFGLLGPNGAGKSSTIRMLVGLTRIDSGTVELLGHDVKRRTPQLKRRIGYVPELHHLYGWMTVQEIIQFVSTFYGTWDAGLCDQLLSLFELPPDKKVKSLSKGMTAKLGLLLALAHRPELLILDEPTSGLDPLAREEFLDGVLRAGGQTDQTVLFSSHQVDDVERIADEIGIMAQGRLVIHQSVDSVRNDVKRIRAVLQDGSLPQHVPPETMWQAINRREWTLTVYPFRQGTLDDVVRNNPVVNAEVIDISLEDIFKDVVRGQKEGAARGPTT